MNINTGDLTHIIRQETLPKGSLGYKAGDFVANHFAGVKSSLRPVLSLANFGPPLGTKAMSSITKRYAQCIGHTLWTPAMPKSYKVTSYKLQATIDMSYELQATSTMQNDSATLVACSSVARNSTADKVVYFPQLHQPNHGTPEKIPRGATFGKQDDLLLQKAVTKSSSPRTWISSVVAPSGKVKVCSTLPIAKPQNSKPPFGKPASKANILSSAIKAPACIACAKPFKR